MKHRIKHFFQNWIPFPDFNNAWDKSMLRDLKIY